MKQVIIYTDGACSGNPGVGGWAAILKFGEHEKQISGTDDMTTNNRMELQAAIEALKLLKEPCQVELFSDSAYLVNAFKEGWIYGWKKNGWKRGKDILQNAEQWQELYRLHGMHKISWQKVKGHGDNPYNNACDKLATDEIKKYKKSLQELAE